MNVQLPEDLGCVQQVRVLDDPRARSVSHLVVAQPELQSSGRIACPRWWWVTYFLAFQANSGRLTIKGSQYPLMRNRKVKNPCTAASGMM